MCACRSAAEFERSCKLLASHPQVLAKFVRSMDPDTYVGLFKESLTPPAIVAVAHALKADLATAKHGSGSSSSTSAAATGAAAEAPAAVAAAEFAERALERLTTVPRFGMVVNMLPRADKEVLREVLENLETKGRDTAALKAKYRV